MQLPAREDGKHACQGHASRQVKLPDGSLLTACVAVFNVLGHALANAVDEGGELLGCARTEGGYIPKRVKDDACTKGIVQQEEPVPTGDDRFNLGAHPCTILFAESVVDISDGIVDVVRDLILHVRGKGVLVETSLGGLTACARKAAPIDGKLECVDLLQDVNEPALASLSGVQASQTLVADQEPVLKGADRVSLLNRGLYVGESGKRLDIWLQELLPLVCL